MSNPINGISWQDVNQTQTQGTTPQGTPKPSDYSTTSTGSSDNDDTVQISVSAQVKQLNQQGVSEKEIASQLGLTVKDVESYLGDDLTEELAALTAATTTSTQSAS